MGDFIGGVVFLLVMVAITLVATVLVVTGFIGVGALFARYTELTLFQATVITVPVGMAALYMLRRTLEVPPSPYQQEDEWDEWDEWDEDIDFEDLSPEERRQLLLELVEWLREHDPDVVVEPPKSHRSRRRR